MAFMLSAQIKYENGDVVGWSGCRGEYMIHYESTSRGESSSAKQTELLIQ